MTNSLLQAVPSSRASWQSLFVHWRITPVGEGSGQTIFK
jgi:hypothetical protein